LLQFIWWEIHIYTLQQMKKHCNSNDTSNQATENCCYSRRKKYNKKRKKLKNEYMYNSTNNTEVQETILNGWK
jgi:hypothetical protein